MLKTDPSSFQHAFYNEQASKLIDPAIKQLQHIFHTILTFNLIFLFLFITQVVILIGFYSVLQTQVLFSLMLSTLFLTIFSYMILRLYFYAKKPEQLSELKDQYLQTCRDILNYQEGIPDHHIAISNSMHKLALVLKHKESQFFKAPSYLKALSSTLKKASCYLFWHDIYYLREALLLASIEEHIKLIKCEPTSLQVHVALANRFVSLSTLYSSLMSSNEEDEFSWVHLDPHMPELESKFKAAAEKATEEFKILNDFAPDDPWIHIQLAYSYHDLQMPQEEIKEYEYLMALKPSDPETLFKLGVLYFQQGYNAKGLKLYKDLKRLHFKKAEDLIKFYGSDSQLDYLLQTEQEV